MQLSTFSKHPLILGTVLLTFAGFLSRIIGFFYRIFLSHMIGAEGLGIYQLIFPVYTIAFALCVAGIQTAISKYVAEASAGYHHNTKNKQPKNFTYLYAGMFLSLSFSILCSCILYWKADLIAISILKESRCASLIKIMALTIPLSAIHSSINGYYYGLQKTTVPAISQLTEQLSRVGAVYLFYLIATSQGKRISVDTAVWGLVFGEAASVLFTLTFTQLKKSTSHFLWAGKNILFLSGPLTLNRVLVNVFHSVESILIPEKLKLFGYTQQEALSVFGILTGMAMPLVFFPAAITNSVAVMLLPAISEACANQNIPYIKRTIQKSCFFCVLLGFGCTLLFFFFGPWMGKTIYHNELAGTFLMILGWICPFLYITTVFTSILNGMGKTEITFFLNLLGSGIRIFFVIFLLPIWGMKAYLWGMLISHVLVVVFLTGILWYLFWKKNS